MPLRNWREFISELYERHRRGKEREGIGEMVNLLLLLLLLLLLVIKS
jgi:hypothetical protein